MLSELADAPVEFALDEALREQILRGKRARRLENVSIKLDPTHVQGLRKIATMKAIPSLGATTLNFYHHPPAPV